MNGNATPIQKLLGDVKLDGSDSLVDQIYRCLRDRIVSLDLRPGSPLPEKEIATALNASKTPVREAMIRLAQNDLVYIVPKSGTYVTRISINRYIEACFVRLRLETGAVRRAAEVHTAEDIVRLGSCVTEQRQAWEAEAHDTFYALDEQFHRLLFEAARIPGVWDIQKRVTIDMDRIRQLKSLYGIRRGGSVINQHQAILDAIRARDADRAVAAMIDHIGALDSEIDALCAHPKILQAIEELNDGDTRKRVPKKGGEAA